MAAYGAADSLLKTLLQLESTSSYPYPQIALLLAGVYSLSCFLNDNREVKREFETRIRDAIYEAQDIIDSHMLSTYFLSPSKSEISRQSFCQDLERVEQKISSIAQMTTQEFNHLTLDRKISNSVWKPPDEIDCTKKYPLQGRDEDLNQIKDRLMSGSAHLQVVPIVGIAGMGKRALAHRVLGDQLIREHFDATYWVKVSTKLNKRDILLFLLISTRKRGDGIRLEEEYELQRCQYYLSDVFSQMTDEQLKKHLYNNLRHKRYLVLLDDIREVAAWDDLKDLFPDYHNGSRILLTTRNVDVAPSPHYQLNAMSDEDTFNLLWMRTFYGKSSPHVEGFLVDMAREIARCCRGLPHAAVIAGNLLSCATPTAEYWEMVLSSINTCDNYLDPFEALVSLTYMHLPQSIKVRLLYIALFPYNDPIPEMKLMNLWRVERFFEHLKVRDIFNRGLLACFLSRDYSTFNWAVADEVFHGFLQKKAKEELFFLVINKETNYALLQEDNTYYQQRRLSIQQNIHRFIKHRPKSHSNSSVRCLIYSGPNHQTPLSAWLEDFKLLEILDAVKISVYTFPHEILKLFQLRYLALSYNGELPATLCNLRHLQDLVVSRCANLKCSGVPSYLHAEIWNLTDLVQLCVMGSDLPEPPSGTDPLVENLRQLSHVSTHSCTRNIFERIPRLKSLKVRIESLPEDESWGFFSYLDILNQLVLFECIVVYPHIVPHAVPCSIPIFPSTLRDLTLSGCGFPWEYIKAIASLPGLRNLRLQTCAFQGPEWEVRADEFPKLQFLLLEDMDFKTWTFAVDTGSSSNSSFPMLEDLVIRHCYRLRDIPSAFEDYSPLNKVAVIDCSSSAMKSAVEIKQRLRSRNAIVEFNINSSLDGWDFCTAVSWDMPNEHV